MLLEKSGEGGQARVTALRGYFFDAQFMISEETRCMDQSQFSPHGLEAQACFLLEEVPEPRTAESCQSREAGRTAKVRKIPLHEFEGALDPGVHFCG